MEQAGVVKPLFLPLKAEYYDQFASGEKRDELRLYGPHWNERTCPVGRPVILSRGYGKQHRLRARIFHFKRQRGYLFGSTYKAAILACYGTLDIDIAVISFTDIPLPLA